MEMGREGGMRDGWGKGIWGGGEVRGKIVLGKWEREMVLGSGYGGRILGRGEVGTCGV